MCRLRYLSTQTGPRILRLLPPDGLDPRYAEFLLYAPTEITPNYPLMAGSAIHCSGFEQLPIPSSRDAGSTWQAKQISQG